MIKQCKECKQEKSTSEFHAKENGKFGVRTVCKQCISAAGISNERKEYLKEYYKNNKEKYKYNSEKERNRDPVKAKARYKRYYNKTKDTSNKKRLERIYKLDPGQWDMMHKEQEGKCYLCRKEESAIEKKTGNIIRLAVDHCHATGKVRGLACKKCNMAIGLLNDDIELIEHIAKTLKQFKNQ